MLGHRLFSHLSKNASERPDKGFARALLVDAAGLGKFVRFQGRFKAA
jgi:hypothetical protein